MSKLYPPGLGVLYELYIVIYEFVKYEFGLEPRIVSVWTRTGNILAEAFDAH
jgi:hypothetical protein